MNYQWIYKLILFSNYIQLLLIKSFEATLEDWHIDCICRPFNGSTKNKRGLRPDKELDAIRLQPINKFMCTFFLLRINIGYIIGMLFIYTKCHYLKIKYFFNNNTLCIIIIIIPVYITVTFQKNHVNLNSKKTTVRVKLWAMQPKVILEFLWYITNSPLRIVSECKL